MLRDIKKEAVLESLENGATSKAACEKAGISQMTFSRWKRDDLEFAAQVEAARETAVDLAEDYLFENVKKGNVVAQIFFLCNRRSDKWKNVNKIEYEDVTKLPAEQLERECKTFIAKLSGNAAGVGSPERGRAAG